MQQFMIFTCARAAGIILINTYVAFGPWINLLQQIGISMGGNL
jgi:hypothetical protein